MFSYEISVPIWGLILLIFLLPILIALVRSAPNNIQTNSQTLDYKMYRKDRFFGIDWFWDYWGGKIDEDNMHARCPNCSNLLDFERHHQPTKLICSSCGYDQVFQVNKAELIHNVANEIDRKIYTGEFQKKIKNGKS